MLEQHLTELLIKPMAVMSKIQKSRYRKVKGLTTDHLSSQRALLININQFLAYVFTL